MMRNGLLLSSALALAISVPAFASAQQTPAPQQEQDAEVTVTTPDQGQASQETDGANVTVIPPQENTEAGTEELSAEGETVEPATTDEAASTEEVGADAAPADTASTPAAGPATTGSGVEVSADDMMGRPVMGSDGEQIGDVADVIVDPETKEMRRIVINSGGFLGFGGKMIALDRDQVEIRPEEGIIARELTRDDAAALPEFDPDAETASLDAPEPATPAPAGPAGGVAPAPAPQ